MADQAKNIYTKKKEKTVDNWLFHPEYYTENTKFIPLSIQRELVKRLQGSVRMPIDDVKQLHPVIAQKLDSICAAYKNKQVRSRVSSARRRQPQAAAEEVSESDLESVESEEEEEEHDELNVMIELMRLKKVKR